MIVQGRKIAVSDIRYIRELIASHPDWHRTRISRELCRMWDWVKPNGQLKDMACRTLLLKLEKIGHIALPKRRREHSNRSRDKSKISAAFSIKNISCDLKVLAGIKIHLVHPGSSYQSLFDCLLSHYHYLGYKTTVGENMKYFVTDRFDHPLSCVLFGSAAWKTEPRDVFIGWSREIREKNVNKITNNTRFLILPWVKVPHLASHILGAISRRISEDWVNKYGSPVYMLETFVDRSRFKGTCYKAANWILTGQTKGRTRNDRHTAIHATIKDVYVYPLSEDFRDNLIS